MDSVEGAQRRVLVLQQYPILKSIYLGITCDILRSSNSYSTAAAVVTTVYHHRDYIVYKTSLWNPTPNVLVP